MAAPSGYRGRSAPTRMIKVSRGPNIGHARQVYYVRIGSFDTHTAQISAPNNAKDRPYIESASLNGQPLSRNFLRHEEITAAVEELAFE